MSTVLLVAGIWLVAVAVAAVVAVGLGRAAARGDEVELQYAAEPQWTDRRTGPPDRRAVGRPFETASPGRRREDLLRAELAEARERIAELEALLVEVEGRRASGEG